MADRKISIQSISNMQQGDQLLREINDLVKINNSKKIHAGPLFVGESDEIKQIRSMLPNVAQSRDPIVIVGERGTGKELLARLIAGSSDVGSMLIKIDCGVSDHDAMINREFRKVLKSAKEGKAVTLLLYQIHSTSAKLQNDLLLLMEELERTEMLTGYECHQCVRLIVTSENKIEDLVSTGAFRKDLFYRLNVIPIYIPPLRDRKSDIPLLLDYALIGACVNNNKCSVILSDNVREMLCRYDWPGNTDELNSYMYRVSINGNESILQNNSRLQPEAKSPGEVLLQAASINDLPKAYEIQDLLPSVNNMSLKSICNEFVSITEKKLVRKALESTNWNRKKAAHLLNISYKSMLNKIKAYELC